MTNEQQNEIAEYVLNNWKKSTAEEKAIFSNAPSTLDAEERIRSKALAAEKNKFARAYIERINPGFKF